MSEDTAAGDQMLNADARWLAQAGDWVVIRDRLAALIAQARADGAAEERERILGVMEQTWADPTGRWNADQAEAAARQKVEMFRRIARDPS